MKQANIKELDDKSIIQQEGAGDITKGEEDEGFIKKSSGASSIEEGVGSITDEGMGV